jgi:CRP-like cAMP-binding protein
MSLILRKHLEEIIALTDAEFAHILTFFTERRFRRHQFVVQTDNSVDHDFFVLEGLLKASYLTESGKEYIVQFAMENWWISDYDALNNRVPAISDIACIEDTTVLCLSYENKKKLCAGSHKMEHFFRIKTGTGFIALQKRLLSFMMQDTQARYRQLFETYPTLFQRVPKSMIAAYLGVSRETLSRLSAP